MTEIQSLSLYTVAILGGAVAGGVLPLVGPMRRSDLLLSFSAGVMLGAAFFHMLPEAVELGGAATLPAVLLGFLALYLLERFVLIHICGEPGMNEALATGTIDRPHDHHPGHVHGDEAGCEVHTLGLAAWVGMSLHTMVDGFALGAANHEAGLGVLVFFAILAHKIPSSFSLSAILRSEGYGRLKALWMNGFFALMVPVGAGLYVGLRQALPMERFTAFALAFSGGTFLHLSLSDILPDLHRRAGSKWRLTGALLAGLAVMWAVQLLRHEH
jgi:zinc and cadmium transporter